MQIIKSMQLPFAEHFKIVEDNGIKVLFTQNKTVYEAEIDDGKLQPKKFLTYADQAIKLYDNKYIIKIADNIKQIEL